MSKKKFLGILVAASMVVSVGIATSFAEGENKDKTTDESVCICVSYCLAEGCPACSSSVASGNSCKKNLPLTPPATPTEPENNNDSSSDRDDRNDYDRYERYYEDYNSSNSSSEESKDEPKPVKASKRSFGVERIKGSAIIKLIDNNQYLTRTDLQETVNSLKIDDELFLRRVEDKAVTYQWLIYVENIEEMADRIELGVQANHTETAELFEKWFDNNVSAVMLNHEGDIGTTLRLAVKADISDLDKDSLIAYIYNPETNTYKRMTGANIFVDKNGYVHINVSEGGAIILTDKPLKVKSK